MLAFQSLVCTKGTFKAVILGAPDFVPVNKFHDKRNLSDCRCLPCLNRRHERAVIRIVKGWGSRPFKGARFGITYSDGTAQIIALGELRLLLGIDVPAFVERKAA